MNRHFYFLVIVNIGITKIMKV